MAFFINSKLGFAPFFVYCPEYHSGILVFPPPVLLSRFPSREIPASTPYTLHQKNRPKKRFFLLNQKKYCTFAPVISPRLSNSSLDVQGILRTSRYGAELLMDLMTDSKRTNRFLARTKQKQYLCKQRNEKHNEASRTSDNE